MVFSVVRCSGQSNSFMEFNSYDKIHNNKSKIVFTDLKLDNIKSTNRYCNNGYFIDSTIYKEYVCIINNEFRVMHKFPNLELRGLLDYQDSIGVGNRMFCLNNLIKNNNLSSPFICYAYKFVNKNRQLLLLQIVDNDSRAVLECENLIFDVTNILDVSFIGNIKSLFVYPNFFGDFNSDGEIEVCTMINNEKIIVYKIDTALSVVEDKFIKIQYDQLSGCYKIDIKATNWFYPLKEQNNNINCNFRYLSYKYCYRER